MKPSKDLDEQIEDILQAFALAQQQATDDCAAGAIDEMTFEVYDTASRDTAKTAILALIEQREREARIDELEMVAVESDSSAMTIYAMERRKELIKEQTDER